MTSPQDIGQNFFLTPDSLGKPLAEETTKFLRELNSGVAGEGKVAVSATNPLSVCSTMEADPVIHVRQDVATLLESDPAYFLSFTLIIAVNLPAAVEDKLSALLWQGESHASFRKAAPDQC